MIELLVYIKFSVLYYGLGIAIVLFEGRSSFKLKNSFGRIIIPKKKTSEKVSSEVETSIVHIVIAATLVALLGNNV